MLEEKQSEKIDLLFETIGTWGRYQLLQLAVINLFYAPAAFQLYIYMYLGYQPPFRCKSMVNITSYPLFTNITLDTTYHRRCQDLVEYHNGSATTTTGTCQNGYDFEINKEATIVSHWDLVCENSYLAKLSQTVLVLGQGCGAFLFSVLADKYGRKKICLISQWIMLVTSAAVAFSPNIYVFIALRFFIGTAQQGHVMIGHVMPLEVLPKKWRTTVHIMSTIAWSILLFALCGLAYAFQDGSWRYFQVSSVAASILSIIPSTFLLDESIRWLLANGKTEEARVIIYKAARRNDVEPEQIKGLVQDILDRSIELHEVYNRREEETQKSQRYTVVDIFRHKALRITIFIMAFAWIFNAGTSFGLALTAGKMSGDRFINYLLINLTSLPAGIVAFLSMQRLGRRVTSIIAHLIAGVALVCVSVLSATIGPSGWVRAFTIIGKFGIGISWGTLFQYTPELFPTNLRSVGLGISSSSSRIGGMLAPFAAIVMDYYVWLPGAIYGSGCLIVVILLFFLDETSDKELPQTIEEIKAWKKKIPRETSNEVIQYTVTGDD